MSFDRDDDDWLTSIEAERREVEARKRGRVAPTTDGSKRQHAIDPGAPQRTSRFFSADELDGKPVPPREWLVPELIPAKAVTILGGDGGTGKSLLAMQLACAVALDRTWLAREVQPGGAVFISAEDDADELHRRLADIACAEGFQMAELQRLTIRSLAGEVALLAAQDGRAGPLQATALFEEVDVVLADQRPQLLVLDTLADMFSGNENDRMQAVQFIGLLRGLAVRHGCAVVLLAHPSLSGLHSGSGSSGSTGWGNSVRSRLYFERVKEENREHDPGARVLRAMKANYSQIGTKIDVRWEDGIFRVPPQMMTLDRASVSAKAEKVFLQLLTLFEQQHRKVNHAGGSTYAPAVFAKHPQSDGVTKAGFARAMEALLAAGKIRIAKDGPPSKQRQYLAVVK